MGNACCGDSTRQPLKLETENTSLSTEEAPSPTPHEEQTPPKPPGVQHISDREDLTSHEGTLFSTKTDGGKPVVSRRRSSKMLADSRDPTQSLGSLSASKKFSSCGTIFLDESTVSQPNLKTTLSCVAIAAHIHITKQEAHRTPRLLDIFDEKLHPLTRDAVPDDYDTLVPDEKQIYKFLKILFSSAKLSAECAIITLVYLERLLHYAEIDLHPSNWKWMVLGSVLLASKVWDDQAVWNVDYCQILRDVSVEDMNELERHLLELLQFNINVDSSVYAKYYFDLRTLAEQRQLILDTSEPLTKERAARLEALSSATNRFETGPIRRTNSMDNIVSGKTPVVIP